MPATPVADAVAAYARRSAAVGFVAGASRATFAVGVVGAVGFLALHLSGAPPRPHPAWAVALVPVLGWGLWRARGARVPDAVAAGELDRRLAADGLLVSAAELGEVGPDWHRQLQLKLAGLRAALPPLPWVLWWPGPVLAVLLAALLGSLGPTTVVSNAPTSGAFAARLADAQTLLQAARLAGTMAPELAEELAGSLERLAPMAGDAAFAWRELDGVLARIAREQLLARLDGERGTPGAGDASAAIAKVQELGRSLLADPALSAAGRQLVESMLGGAGGDLAAKLAEAQRSGEWAGRFAGLADELLQRAGELGLEARDLRELGAFADSLREQGARLRPASGSGRGERVVAGGASGSPEVSGNGPGRGPGHVARTWSEPVAGAAEQALPLPPGGAGAQPWVPVGAGLGAPGVAPVAGTASGVAPAAGRGGASWQLQLAPHHRAVVQKFFAGEPAPGSGEGKR
ncbi:MAG: hypothetical protein JNK15_18520 [Planctomycetes bacterium]|nr:hypothetical protein [Planctomycetota bacterium]